MKSIFTLLKAELRHTNIAFICAAILMALVTIAFSGTVSNNDNLDRELRRSIENARLGDIIVTLEESEMTDELAEKLDHSNIVDKWTKRQCVLINSYVMADDNKIDHSVRLAKSYDTLRVMNDNLDGFVDKNIPGQGEVFVSYVLARQYDLEKGSEITFQTACGEEKLKIAGFTEDPLYGSLPLACENFYISDEDYNRLLNKSIDGSTLSLIEICDIFHNGDLSNNDFLTKLNEECGILDHSLLYLTQSHLIELIKMYSDVGTYFLLVFVILLIAVIIITIHNSISSSVETDMIKLGILKSQGFTSLQIRLVYIMQYVIAMLIGMILGIILSVPLLAYLGKLFIQFTDIVTYGQIAFGKCLLIALVIIIVCTIFIIFSTAKISRISPVRAISGGKADVYFSSRLNVRIRKKPLSFFVALRQITSKKRRYIGTCFISAILVFFMCSISVFTKEMSSEEVLGSTADIVSAIMMKPDFDYDDTKVLENTIHNEYPDAEVDYYSEYGIEINDKAIHVLVTNEMEKHVVIYDGRMPVYANEIAITEITADEIGCRIGDTVSLYNDTGDKDVLITGLYQYAGYYGKTCLAGMELGKSLGIPIESAFVRADDITDADTLTAFLNRECDDLISAEKYETTGNSMEIINSLLKLVRSVVYTISAVFVFVVVSMLCQKLLLLERRDIGIFKSQGFPSSHLRTQFALRFLFMGIIGSAIGSLLAFYLTKPLLTLILRQFGYGIIFSDIDFLTLFMPSLLICLCLFVFAYFFAANMKKVAVRELITE